MERRVLFEGGLDVDFALIPQRRVQQLAYLLRVRKRFPQILACSPRPRSGRLGKGLPISPIPSAEGHVYFWTKME